MSPGRLQSSPFLCRFFSFLSFFLLRISLYSWAFPSASCSLRMEQTNERESQQTFPTSTMTSASALANANNRARTPVLCLLSRRLSRADAPDRPPLPPFINRQETAAPRWHRLGVSWCKPITPCEALSDFPPRLLSRSVFPCDSICSM